jgi:hypothetical protein
LTRMQTSKLDLLQVTIIPSIFLFGSD